MNKYHTDIPQRLIQRTCTIFGISPVNVQSKLDKTYGHDWVDALAVLLANDDIEELQRLFKYAKII